MIDGVNAMAALVHQMRAIGYRRDDPATNFFLNASPFYEVFECADGEHVTLVRSSRPSMPSCCDAWGWTMSTRRASTAPRTGWR